MKPHSTKDLISEVYRKIMDELTPAERTAILTIIALLIIGAAVKIISQQF